MFATEIFDYWTLFILNFSTRSFIRGGAAAVELTYTMGETSNQESLKQTLAGLENL